MAKGRHPKNGSRSQQDEVVYDAQLRDQHDVMTEVIVELREAVAGLLETQRTLLRNLIASQDALRVYRLEALKRVEQLVALPKGHCLPGCDKHEWRDKDGWHRREGKREVTR
jgi:hypothetical protein